MNNRQDGTILVLALLVSAAASVMGIYLLLTSDLRSRANRYLVRAADASRLALSGLQIARLALDDDPLWTGGTYPSPDDPGSSISVSADPIASNRSQVTSTGAVNDATQLVVAELKAVADPVLGFRAYSATSIVLQDAAFAGSLRANGAVMVQGALDFGGTVETLEGAVVDPAIPAAQVVRVPDALPPPDVSIAQYAGFSSSVIGLPYDTKEGAFVIEREALRPDRNAFGGTNADGAYVIDARGRDVLLRDVFVLGTLTVVNCARLRIEGGFHLERAAPELASLLCDGDIDIAFQNDLDELGFGFDFNGDGDLRDVHPRLVEGVVYAAGGFTGPYDGEIRGTVAADSLRIVGTPHFTPNGLLDTQPVTGFIEPGAWDVVPGSIAKGTLP